MDTKLQRIKFKIRRKWKMIKIEYRYHKGILTNQRVVGEVKWSHFKSMVTRRCKGNWCDGKRRAYIKHSNCAYVEEISNYNYCCEECHEEIDAMYQEWWDEYNAGRL